MTEREPGHHLKKELGLRDLVQMQILMVVGVTWIGIAAKQGGTHVVFWIAAILGFFLPSAAVITYCVRLWPEEGGVYQWTRHALGPFAGFMSAWNFGLWALLAVSNIGLMSATSLAYSLGARFAWMAESHPLIAAMNVGLFALILLVCIPGFGIGKWVSHFGTAIMILVNLVLVALLFYHPHATALHPHVSPQKPFLFTLRGSLLFPAGVLISVNFFSKMAFNALTGLEQIAVFAGETRDPARSIWRSAWIAAPIIALIFILGTASILTYVPAATVDLVGPVPQILAAAFSGANTAPGSVDWGLMLGRAAILGLALSVIAQYALIVAETSRLPMVAGWDGLVPAWFTRLSPRFGTPVRSIVFIVLLAIGACFLATSGAGAQEAFQLLTSSGNIFYAIYFGMMFLIPLVVGSRFGRTPGLGLKIGAGLGFLITLLATAMNLYPIVDVPSPLRFAAKVLGTSVLLNVIGAGVYWNARRTASPARATLT